jgi:preprotein translocase subunit SecY
MACRVTINSIDFWCSLLPFCGDTPYFALTFTNVNAFLSRRCRQSAVDLRFILFVCILWGLFFCETTMDPSSESRSIEDIEQAVWGWRPCAVLRRTNWLYRIDALRSNDIDHLNLLWSNVIIQRETAVQF